jgi:hypothetical protein
MVLIWMWRRYWGGSLRSIPVSAEGPPAAGDGGLLVGETEVFRLAARKSERPVGVAQTDGEERGVRKVLVGDFIGQPLHAVAVGKDILILARFGFDILSVERTGRAGDHADVEEVQKDGADRVNGHIAEAQVENERQFFRVHQRKHSRFLCGSECV